MGGAGNFDIDKIIINYYDITLSSCCSGHVGIPISFHRLQELDKITGEQLTPGEGKFVHG